MQLYLSQNSKAKSMVALSKILIDIIDPHHTNLTSINIFQYMN